MGWAAGFAVTSPVQIVEVLRNSGSNLPLMLSALGYGLAVWLLITLTGVAAIWVGLVSPVALFVPSRWLLRHRVLVITVCVCLGVLAVSYMVHVWTHFYHDGVGLMNFWIYAGFVAAFSGVTAYSYLRFLSREE
jgi:hypothetical protein